MAVVVETFDSTKITNGSIQVLGTDGNQVPGKPFGCIGSVEGETEIKKIIKICEGVETNKISKPIKMNLTLSGHIQVNILRDIFGLQNTTLKAGVYSYNVKSLPKEFTFTADVVDEFGDQTKLIAFPRVKATSGLKITISNNEDELAEIELELTVYPDSADNFYYEAIISELADQTLANTWHTTFNYDLVKETVL